MSLLVRPATPDDEPQVVTLWQACGLVVPTNDPATDFRFARARTGSDVLVGQDPEGALLGSVMVGHDGHRGWLYYVACHPDHRAHGIGRQMVAAGEAWLRARGVVKVQLLVRDTNTAVVAFYARLGFDVTPRTVMAKWLEPPDNTA
ncbi:GNAT family acetyltransferase [Lichenihabitans sp. Uapishka_5]|uniref:GNAT family acetyltransferase n=1 Tax=Lichenihabitans sp. Uapishka_5 TaxID=3037302 RepID=UPI0029E80FC3|nr:GNAT family acetyltransferase [Lichenihabitans sp. Uapishka_5]MDX7952683.1 GNAT family acetyltransferase [Lichenihabitans sp. Uapishka_5]